MAISHIKSNTIADFTGTVTVFNSAGTTATANATDLVRPTDWNSVHNFFQTISGNTQGTSTMSGTNLVFAGGNNITLSNNTAAGAATISIHGNAPQTGISGIANSETTYTSGSVTFRDLNGISWQSTTGQQFQIAHGLQFTSNTSNITSNAVNTNAARIQGVIGSNTTYTSGSVGLRDLNGITWQSTTGQSFQITHDLQYTSNTSNITSNALNTSASRVINIIAATNNTGGGTASLSSNVSFSNANGLTFYTSAGNAVVASYTVPAAQTGISGIQVSDTTYTSGTVTFRNANGISFGSSGANGISASYTVPTQTNQTIGVYGSSQTTGSASSGTYDARSVSIIGAGIISVGNHSTSAGGTTTGIIISATQSNQTLGIYASSNTTGQSSSSTYDARSLSVVGAGIASVGWSNSSLIISVPSGGGAGDGVNIIAAGTQTANTTGTVGFTNSNNISFGMSDSSQVTASYAFRISANTTSSDLSNITFGDNGLVSFFWGATATAPTLLASVNPQTNQTGEIFITAQSTGQSSRSTYDLRTLSMVGDGIVSIGWSNSTLRVSATQSNQAFSAGAASSTFQTLSFQDTSNVSFSNNAGAIRISHNLAGTGTAITGRASITLNSTGLSFNGSALVGSATSTATTTGTYAFAANSSGISISNPVLTRLIVPDRELTAVSAPGNASASFVYVQVPNWLTGTRIDALVGMSGGSSATANTGAIAMSMYAAIYSRNASTLSSMSSGSTQTTFTYASNSAGQTQLTQSAVRMVSVPVNFNMAPGNYIVGFNLVTATSSVGTATTNMGLTMSMYGGNGLQTALGVYDITANTTTSSGLYGGMGVGTAATTGIPASISIAAINQTGASLSQANIALVFRNA